MGSGIDTRIGHEYMDDLRHPLSRLSAGPQMAPRPAQHPHLAPGPLIIWAQEGSHELLMMLV